jgi:hypothetical protein
MRKTRKKRFDRQRPQLRLPQFWVAVGVFGAGISHTKVARA